MTDTTNDVVSHYRKADNANTRSLASMALAMMTLASSWETTDRARVAEVCKSLGLWSSVSAESLASHKDAGVFLATAKGSKWLAAGGNPLALSKKIATAKGRGVPVDSVRGILAESEDVESALVEAGKVAATAKKEKGEEKMVAQAATAIEILTKVAELLALCPAIALDDHKARNALGAVRVAVDAVTVTPTALRPKRQPTKVG